MPVFLAPGPFGAGYQAFDSNGVPLNGGFINTYAAGTTTSQATFTTSGGTVTNANPIQLSTDGRPQNSGNLVEIWLTSGIAYKFQIVDSLSNQIAVYDNLSGINDVAAVSSEWVAGTTPSFVNATQFTVASNLTSTYTVSRRVKAVVTAGTIYGTISASAFTTLTTVTVDWDSTQLDSGLSAISYALLDAANISIPSMKMDGSIETITSAGTIDLGTTRSRNVIISGSTAITRLSIPDGQVRFLTFNSTPTLSNTVSQILLASSGTTITTNTGSTAIFRGEPGLARMIAYSPSNVGKQPSRTVLTSGSGTYNTPTGATRINVRLIGGGGGGGGATANNGTAGNNTTFGTLTGSGGGAGAGNGGGGGAGGAAAGGDINIPGGGGGGGSANAVGGPTLPGGNGGQGYFGGGAGISAGGAAGTSGATNSGGGASGGGGDAAGNSGAGGAAGGYVEKLFTLPATSFSYSVGASANGGAAGTHAGGVGAAGQIIIDEFYD